MGGLKKIGVDRILEVQLSLKLPQCVLATLVLVKIIKILAAGAAYLSGFYTVNL